MRPLSLIHLVNGRSANVGNGALTEGAEGVLADDLARPVRWTRDAWDDYTFGQRAFDRGFVDAINAADGMIVGGAVAINGREFYGEAGMRFNLPAALWPEIRKPVVFYGLSYRFWEGQTYHHADRLRWTLDHILGRDDMLLGLRNDGTREWLQSQFGIASDRIAIVPDPAVFLPADEGRDYPELQPDRPNVLLAFNDEDWVGRYRTAERRTAVLKGIAVAIERLLRERNVNLVLVPHYFDDCRMLADFVDLCAPYLAHQRMIATGLARTEGSRDFYGRYRRADLVVSMRVHSMSPSIGLGVPMVPLVTQDRMTDFLADIGLADLAVDAFAADLSERLYAAIIGTLDQPKNVTDRFAAARATMRTRIAAVNARVAGLFPA